MSDLSSVAQTSPRSVPCFIYASFLAGFLTGFSPLVGLVAAYF